MSNRPRGREVALQILYQLDLTKQLSRADAVNEFRKNFTTDEADLPFTDELVRGVQGNLQQLDNTISEQSHNWKLYRISPIERNVLRLAIFEMAIAKLNPANIVIDEAVELAKKFGSDNSSGFINGILDSVKNSL